MTESDFRDSEIPLIMNVVGGGGIEDFFEVIYSDDEAGQMEATMVPYGDTFVPYGNEYIGGKLTIEFFPIDQSAWTLYQSKSGQTINRKDAQQQVRVELHPEPDHDMDGWFYGTVYVDEAPIAEFVVNSNSTNIHALGATNPAPYGDAIWAALGGLTAPKTAQDDGPKYCSKCGTQKIVSNVTGKLGCPKCGKEKSKTAQAEGPFVYEIMDRLAPGVQSVSAVVYVTEVIYENKQRTPYPCTIVNVGMDGIDVVLTDHGMMFFGKDNMDVSFVLSGVQGSKTGL
jgi:predicted RNA-binding Zn-ribbon protein involved in translation (DUF1610 family)